MSTHIEWSDEVYNPIVGCERVSPGCDRCYAIGVAHRAMQPAHKGLTIRRAGEPTDWTGEVRFLPERLEMPFRWKTPRRVFVNSMSDLFHPAVTVDVLKPIWDVMVATPQHSYQILTKRPQRMAGMLGPEGIGFYAVGRRPLELAVPCPQPNILLGTSVEEARYQFRIRHLQETAAAVRFLSLEPLLGPMPNLDLAGIGWVIVGAESGPGARPMDEGWVREIRDQVVDAGIPFFFKQKVLDRRKVSLPELDGRVWAQFPEVPGDTAPPGDVGSVAGRSTESLQ